MKPLFLAGVSVLLAGCAVNPAARAFPHQRLDEPKKVWLPLTATACAGDKCHTIKLTDDDEYCVPDDGHVARCRTIGEIKRLLYAVNAAP